MANSTYEGPMSMTEQDIPELHALLNRTFRPQGGDMGREYPCHTGVGNLSNMRVIRQNGRIVSHVGTSVRPVLLGGIATAVAGIGAVATDSSARGQGLASRLMEDAVERSVAQGADIMLISGDENIYLRMHATYCGNFPEIRWLREESGSTAHESIHPATPSDLDAIIALRQELPVRYLFPREDLEALLTCRFAMDKPVDWWVVRAEDQPVGWAVIHRREEELELIDWAGHPGVLPKAAGLLCEHYNARSLVYTAPHESMLPPAGRSNIRQRRLFAGTVLILQAKRFLQRAEPYLIETIGAQAWRRLRIEAQPQQVTFVLGDEFCTFEHGGELAQLFFGDPSHNRLDRKIPPASPLHRLLSRCFPVPLVWYGIGYV